MHARTQATVDLSQIRKNLRALSGLARSRYRQWDGCVAMVKCNAYGHGAVEVSRALEPLNEALAFGVATIAEGVTLRKSGIQKPIWVFSECAPLSTEAIQALAKYKLSPILHASTDLEMLLKRQHARFCKDLGVHLKFNTGMNRLGIPMSEYSKISRLLSSKKINLEGICSHFATSEEPSGALAQKQVERFRAVVSETVRFHPAFIHFANTAGILGEDTLEVGEMCNVARPGIGLYGYAGKANGLVKVAPALKWQARVALVRRLERGDFVGYGATFKATRQMQQHVLGVGYGDGFMRALSNSNLRIWAKSKMREAKILGRVSMDLTAVGIVGADNARLRAGDWVTLLGVDENQGHEMAEKAGTIVYEILTAISARVPRVYNKA